MIRSKLVAVVGGTASGKTTLASDLLHVGGRNNVDVIPLDAYYRCNAHLALEDRARVNYDHPAAFEVSLLKSHLQLLSTGEDIDIPSYDFATHSRSTFTRKVEPRSVIIVEGILTLHFPELRDVFTYSIFVDTPDDLRFSRRLARDVRERGRTEESLKQQWDETVQPMHEEFCASTKLYSSEVMSGIAWTERDVAALWGRVQEAITR